MSSNFPTYVGDSIVVESGVAVLGPDDEGLTVDIRGLKFVIRTASDSKLEAITIKTVARDQVTIIINTWQGSDLTFKFKVGTIMNRDLNLAVNLAPHYNHRIITYTFSQRV
jgi:hypothetical protein